MLCAGTVVAFRRQFCAAKNHDFDLIYRAENEMDMGSIPGNLDIWSRQELIISRWISRRVYMKACLRVCNSINDLW